MEKDNVGVSICRVKRYKSKSGYIAKNDSKENDVMNAATTKKLDKTNVSGLTLDKKKLLKSLQGVASSPIDFNKIRNEQKYGKDT
jgi:hypothetical protein